MKSPNQARPKSSPKAVTGAKGMARGRITPTSKTPAKPTPTTSYRS